MSHPSTARTARPPRPARAARSWAAEFEGIVPDRVLFSPWLRRLGRIGFLGALDRSPACRLRPTRLEHSAGVAKLALDLGRAIALEDRDLRHLVTAALLHDIGHFPLSHTAEPAFRARWGLDHHGLSRGIILGEEPVAMRESLAPALREAGLDSAEICALIEGTSSSPAGALLTCAVNLDTLDGIPRAAHAFGKRVPVPPKRLLARRGDELVVPCESLAALDRFWALKDRVYRSIINAPAHAALELRIAALVGQRVAGAPPDELATFDDAALLSLIGLDDAALAPDEAELASRFVAAAPAGGAPVRVLRKYAVDDTVRGTAEGLPARLWPARWKTSKHRWHLVTRSSSVQLLLPGCWELEGDLP